MLEALVAVIALVAVSTALGLLWRARTGRTRTTAAGAAEDRVDPAVLGGALGERVTLLQLSTELCAVCRPTARLLRTMAASTGGAAHLEVLLDRRPDLADRFAVLQTPTTLVLDGRGVIRARVSGAPKPGDLEQAVAKVLEDADARTR